MKRNDLTYIIGDENIAVQPIEPYSEIVCEFLNEYSRRLRANKTATGLSDVMSLAFWCRKANILRLKEQFDNTHIRLGRGLVFHITPGNVPVNFMFSYLFGLLSGNANIVRIPPKPFPQVSVLLETLKLVLQDERFAHIKQTTAFVDYGIIDEITAHFSSICNARIIWGGNRTIESIRKNPIHVRGTEIAFSDRYSFCAIDAPSVLNASDDELCKLGDSFYNDTYLMDQNACSSPMLVIWQGAHKHAAKEKFWNAVLASAQKYDLAPVHAIDKYTQLCEIAIDTDHISYINQKSNLLYCVGLDTLPNNTDDLRGKFGLFYEYDCDDINTLAHIVNLKYQTLTYFGVSKEKLADFVTQNHLLGIDRIVPIGSALDIGIIWDGYDIISTLSRIIDVK
ncbi:MAG: acyl-CoA reductase [Christensenella sp.]